MKKALLTTTALVALSTSAAFASSVDTPVNSASSTHHTHSAATIVWSGDANIVYNAPLNGGDGTVGSDVDLDVTMTSPGSYSATVSTGIEGGAAAALGANATVSVTTPLFNVSVGTNDASGGANGGADASDLYANIDHMTGIGSDEDSSDWYVALPNFGGWTVAVSGERDQSVAGASEQTSFGLTGSVGNLNITAGGMHKSGGASVSTALMGATVKVAFASIHNGTTATQESGVQVDMPLGNVNLSVNSTTTGSTNNWGASVSTTVGGYSVSAGTDSDEDSQVKISGPMGPVTLHVDWDSSDAALTTATDATVEAGVTYAVPGTNGTTIQASYSNADDDFSPGTQVKMAFKF